MKKTICLASVIGISLAIALGQVNAAGSGTDWCQEFENHKIEYDSRTPDGFEEFGPYSQAVMEARFEYLNTKCVEQLMEQ